MKEFVVIPVTKGNTKVYALVDDDIWHELMQYRWSLNKNYPNAVINKRLNTYASLYI